MSRPEVRAHERAALPALDRRWLSTTVKLAAIGLLIALPFLAVRLTGGSPSPLNHLGYGSILLAAYLFGWRGGIATAVAVGALLGPLASWLQLAGDLEGPEAWLLRAAAFVAVGATVGVLFDWTREAKESWRRSALKVIEREREGMSALARGVGAKDGHTGDHVTRVQRLSEHLALAVGYSQAEAHDMGWSAMLHDLGKLHVPDQILLKPGPLTSAEWEIIRGHSIWGAEILAHGEGFEMARRIARWHHENFDGTGYPDNLRRDAIPLEARLVRVADAFDAMTHQRPYREPRPLDWALEELNRYAGRHFDPEVVQLFLELASGGLLETVKDLEGNGQRPSMGAVV
jgi:hypothetical protein